MNHPKSQSTAAELQSIDWSRNFTIDFFDVHTNELLLLRAPERRGPCACVDLNCGCCAGMNIQQFNFKRIREYLCCDVDDILCDKENQIYYIILLNVCW